VSERSAFAWLALPFAFYLIPLLLGFSWNALGEAHNVLNPPKAIRGDCPKCASLSNRGCRRRGRSVHAKTSQLPDV